jgi:hypothetical protein
MINTKLNYKTKKICFFFVLFLFFSVTTSSYGQQINCPNDFDCDGIIDALDVDDDNDGIYDHIESPNCFNLSKDIYETGDRRELLAVTTGLPFTTGTPDLLIDGLTTASNGITIAANTALTDKEIFRTTTREVFGIEYTSVTMTFNSTYFFTATSRVILQGSQDGVVWTELTDIITPAQTIAVTIPVTKNQGTYRMYRLMGTAGNTWASAARIFLEITGTVGSYVPSLYPKANCEGEDIDNDGKPNHQDLDADGDGGSDVLEAGFTDGNKDGMLGSSPITVDQFGAVTSAKGYILPANNYYKIAAINATRDTDDDGIPDVFDVDDDNDGIYDHIESPNCFETNKTVYETGDRRELLAVTTGLPFTTGTPDLLVDGSTTTLSGIRIPAVPVLKGQEIVRVSTQVAIGVEYSAVTLNFTSAGFFTTASRVVLQGTKDGVNWTDLSESVAPGTALAVTIPVTKNQGLYGAYCLMGDAGTATARVLAEITGTVGDYMPSLYPKPTCTGEDFDNDGKPNHQDLNSDGDSCNDVLEAGFLDQDNDGILGISPVTVNQYGKVTSAVGYIIPSNLNYLDVGKNVCTGEGVPIDEDSHCIDMENITNDYSLVQSTFHSNIVRTKTGFSAFGEYTNPRGGHFSQPVDMIPANGFTYEGTIIAATLGGVGGVDQANQFFILSTEGLYTWGSKIGTCIPASWTPSINFVKIGLPTGILPRDVKFMSASFGNLLILTKSGDVYVAGTYYLAYGDGSRIVDNLWHKSNIGRVISIKINSFGQAIALTLQGELYTWGRNVILGNGTAAQDLSIPTKMTLPASIATVKMTALSGTNDGLGATYYILGNDKRVYSLGLNFIGLLGIGESVTQLNWQTVKGPGGIGYLENIKFINASIHDNFYGSAGAINEEGIPYLWGHNSMGRLGKIGDGTGNGSGNGTLYFPTVPDKSSIGDYDIIYIENGGHITPMIDQKLGKFGYVGHSVNGSMGNATLEDKVIFKYDFENTPEIDFCNIIIGGRKVTRVMVNPAIINSKPAKE